MVLEVDARAGHEVFDGPRHKDLAVSGEGSDARSDMHADAADVTESQLHLSGVNAGANVDVICRSAVADCSGCVDTSRRTVEGGEHAVAGCLDEAPAEFGDQFSRARVVLVQEVTPRSVAHLYGALRGPDDVGEEDGRQRSSRRWPGFVEAERA